MTCWLVMMRPSGVTIKPVAVPRGLWFSSKMSRDAMAGEHSLKISAAGNGFCFFLPPGAPIISVDVRHHTKSAMPDQETVFWSILISYLRHSTRNFTENRATNQSSSSIAWPRMAVESGEHLAQLRGNRDGAGTGCVTRCWQHLPDADQAFPHRCAAV